MQTRQWKPQAAVFLVLSAWAFLPATTAAQEHPGHEPLATDPTLTLGVVVETALAVYPKMPILEAQQGQADAWNRRGRSWLLDRPSVIVRYQSDRWGADVGLDEYEAGLELPLWTWGGRSAVKAFGQALRTEAEAAAIALRWEVAGIVREALSNVALAQNALDLAEESLHMAARLVETVERRYELGDVALSDALLARSSHLESQAAVLEAEAALLDAERGYRAVTGLERRPDFAAESLSEASGIDNGHPALALANLVVTTAEADVAVARKTANTGASVLVGTRQERPAFGTEFDESIGVMLTVPFGGGAHRNTEIAAATLAAAQARAARAQQLRQLTLALHEAAHGLTVVRERLATATQRRDIAERYEAMGESAYDKGEIELIDLLRIRERVIAARREFARSRIDEQRQTALYNQAAGELP